MVTRRGVFEAALATFAGARSAPAEASVLDDAAWWDALPIDDEPFTDEERAASERGWQEYVAGNWVSPTDLEAAYRAAKEGMRA